MKTALTVVNAIICLPLSALLFWLYFASQETGLLISAILVLGSFIAGQRWIYDTPEAKKQRADKAIADEANGVHWFFWVLWGIIFLPSLIIVAIIHTSRKNRSQMREIATLKP